MDDQTPTTTTPRPTTTSASGAGLAAALASGHMGYPMPDPSMLPRNSKGGIKRHGGLHPTDRHGQYNASGKVGRNDPCWCGSGVKSKKCQHTALKAQLAERRLKDKAAHRAGDCPSCHGKAGEDTVFVMAPPGHKPLPECPDCGRTLKQTHESPPKEA